MTELTAEARKRIFLACFIALITTAFAFMLRMMIMPTWEADFELDKTQVGTIFGAGLWPFGVSIVLFSLVLDRIGYGPAMAFAFFCFISFAVLSIFATGFSMLYWASILGALGAGTVEAVINPLIADMYKENKTTWLNILHAGWPGGLVLTGIVVLGIGDAMSWQWKIALIIIPACVFGFMMLNMRFPISERVKAGISDREMLRQVGWGGAFIVALLIVMELTTNVLGIEMLQSFGAQVVIAGFIAAIYGMFITDTDGNGLEGAVRSFGRPMYIFLLLIMLALATTELGTDTWIKDLLGPAINNALGIDSGWVLVYTAAIMMTLRLVCGPIVAALKPLGVLAASAAIVTLGIWWLGVLADDVAVGAGVIILAATIYGVGQTFFWPTTLGFVSEQFPKGGAMTINLIAGVGMLGLGVLGSVWLGQVQDTEIVRALQEADAEVAALYVDEDKSSLLGSYSALSAEGAGIARSKDPHLHQEALVTAQRIGKAEALFAVSILPIVMLVSYLCLITWFDQRGGYRPVSLDGNDTSKST
ncbi:MAG: MFS transporter [Phycisphaerales bacterium]|nr:MFS transporter [Phycisphaerales bacterium]